MLRCAVIACALALAPAAEARPVAFHTVARGDGASSELTQRRAFLVRGAERWGEVWRRLEPTRTRPRVNFSRDMVLVVLQGAKTSAGHAIKVTGIDDAGGRLEVAADEVSPGRGCFTAQVVTSPYHVVRLRRLDRTLRVRRHARTRHCGG
jgi:hypothetical protein